MFVVASVHSFAPVASLTASSSSSDGGSTLLVLALILIAAVWIVSLIGRSGSTVVVVDDKPAGSFLGFVLIALALGILYFAVVGPSTGLI